MNYFGYKIVKVIGTGTFGTVFKCIDDNNNVRCVKKIQLANTSNDATNAQHFEMIQQEIYLLQNLTHPRIIGLYEYFCSDANDKCIYIVMEYAANGSLSKMLNDQRNYFGENKIKQFLIDIVLGVEYLHMKNVVHKDLKPCNILVCDNGRLKIADFGVSKITDIDNCENIFQRNRTNEMGGSPIYMAPETLIHKRFSFSSDIWALGCILYELFTLQPAFDSVQSMDELIRCTLTQEYPPLNPDIHFCSKEMVALCAHMMNVNVEKRATIKDVIRNPIIVVHYYHSYFRFDA